MKKKISTVCDWSRCVGISHYDVCNHFSSHPKKHFILFYLSNLFTNLQKHFTVWNPLWAFYLYFCPCTRKARSCHIQLRAARYAFVTIQFTCKSPDRLMFGPMASPITSFCRKIKIPEGNAAIVESFVRCMRVFCTLWIHVSFCNVLVSSNTLGWCCVFILCLQASVGANKIIQYLSVDGQACFTRPKWF